MKTDQRRGNDCYSAGERQWMEGTQAWRGRVLLPLLKLLTALRLRASHITLLSFLCGVLFLPLWFQISPWAAVIALALHVAIDGLDGPLARHQQLASPGGSFTDTVCDQCVIMWVTLTLMLAQVISMTAGTIYVFVYTLVVTFAMVRNALEIPFSWILRPRFFIYGWLVVELTVWPQSLETVHWIFSGILVLKALSGFYIIRYHLAKNTVDTL